jgi:hypothetical protein
MQLNKSVNPLPEKPTVNIESQLILEHIAYIASIRSHIHVLVLINNIM